MPTERPASLLLVDDERFFSDVVRDELASPTLAVSTADSAAAARAALERATFDVVLLDNQLPDGFGASLVPTIRRASERTRIILITANPTVAGAVSVMQAGAFDYLCKPFGIDDLKAAVTRALPETPTPLAPPTTHPHSHPVDETTPRETMALIASAARSMAPVLITGETGTGKTVAARAIHDGSARSAGPFIAVNCAALPESLVEAELFGVESGAFTGATGAKKGRFELAHGGTLFLDEIGEMPIAIQAKLLSALEDRRIQRLGAEHDRPIDVRIIAATNSDLDRAIADRRFRLDLFYRLSVLRIPLPPLRTRPADVAALATFFLRQLAGSSPATLTDGSPVTLADGEAERLAAYPWPGNIRELRNLCELTALVQPRELGRPSALLGQLATPDGGASHPIAPPALPPPTLSLAEVERRHVLAVLASCAHNVSRAAERLGLARSTMKRKLRAYGVR
jgi:DNA-binding NtrC family response regulator